MLSQIFLWIWGILVVGAILGSMIDESIQGHLAGGMSCNRNTMWLQVMLVAFFFPVVLILIPVILMLWACHLLVGIILKRLGIKK